MATITANKEQAMTALETYRTLYNRETSLMRESTKVIDARYKVDRKIQSARRRADRAQSPAAYERINRNVQPHRDEWSRLNARSLEITAELKQVRAEMEILRSAAEAELAAK